MPHLTCHTVQAGRPGSARMLIARSIPDITRPPARALRACRLQMPACAHVAGRLDGPASVNMTAAMGPSLAQGPSRLAEAEAEAEGHEGHAAAAGLRDPGLRSTAIHGCCCWHGRACPTATKHCWQGCRHRCLKVARCGAACDVMQPGGPPGPCRRAPCPPVAVAVAAVLRAGAPEPRAPAAGAPGSACRPSPRRARAAARAPPAARRRQRSTAHARASKQRKAPETAPAHVPCHDSSHCNA